MDATSEGEPAEATATEAGTDGSGTSTVQDTLASIYVDRIAVKPRYGVVALVVLAAWWRLFGVFSTILAGMGLLILISGLDNAATVVASRRWPTTEGVVLESTVLTLRELRDSFEGLGRSGSTSGGYVPLVRYEYTVDGESHVNVRISPFDGKIARRRRAESVVEDYPGNEHVTVRYDPEDPSRAFLRLWTWATWFFVWLVGSAVLLGAAVLLAVGTPVVARLGDSIPPVLFPIAFAGLFVALGLYQVVMGLRTYRWPTTTGTVRATGVKSSSSGESGRTSYKPKLRYEYEVDGDTYVSSRIAVDGWPSFNSRSSARSWLEEYPSDGEVTVRYNPRRPDRSVLEPRGALRGLLLLAIVGAILTLAVVLMTDYSLPVEGLPF